MYWGFCFDFSFPSFSCKVRKGQILFTASPSRVCFPKASKSKREVWCCTCAARRKTRSSGLIIKSVKSAELLILLISLLSYFLETLKDLCTEKAWAQIFMLT